MSANKPDLLHDPVGRCLYRLALPMTIGIVSIFLVNLADTFYIWMLGELPLAAISFTFPVVSVLGTVSLGLGVGATSVISRGIGAKQDMFVRRTATDAIFLAVLIVLSLSTAGYLTIEPLFTLLGADEETLPLIEDYMSIWYFGMCFLVIPMVGNATIRATGDASTPAKIMMFAAGMNCILDPILIFGFGPIAPMGIAGAATATLISRAMAMLMTLWILSKRLKMLTLKVPRFYELLRSWAGILRIGAPAASANAVVPFTVGILTEFVSDFGNDAVASYGMGSRLFFIAMVVPFAVGSSITPLVGQNWGAKAKDRVAETIRISDRFLFKWGLASWVIMSAAGTAIYVLSEGQIERNLGIFLCVVSVGISFQGVSINASSLYNAINLPLKSAGLILLRTPILSVSFAYLGARWIGLEGIFIAIPLSEIITGAVARWSTRDLRGVKIEAA